MPINKEDIQRATQTARAQKDLAVSRVLRALDDTQSVDRRKAMMCVTCFYLADISRAFQVMTKWVCACCGQSFEHPNSAAPMICIDCAKWHDLCAECGGDIDLRDTASRKGAEVRRG